MRSLSGRQRNLLAVLAVANIVLLTAAGALLLAPDAGAEATPAPPLTPDAGDTCQGLAASEMATHGIAGAVTLGLDGSIDFRLSGDDSQVAWEAFAVAARLPQRRCGPYEPIRIDVPDPSLAPNSRLVVEARWADVRAWSQGQIDDQTLSERTTRSTYTASPPPTIP